MDEAMGSCSFVDDTNGCKMSYGLQAAYELRCKAAKKAIEADGLSLL
jgi:hypothetical protein